MIIHVQNKFKEATIINTETERNREGNFCTLSGTDFRTDKPVSEDFFTKPVEQIAVEEVIEETTDLEKLQAQYLEVIGKEAPARYKNDTERLNGKINETLTPAE